MRTVSMCFSVLQAPRCKIHTLANSWCESLSKTFGKSSGCKLFASKTYGVEGGGSKRWSRGQLTSKTDGTNKTTRSSKSVYIRQEILEGTLSPSASLGVHKSETSEPRKVPLPDIRQQIAENKFMLDLVTVIVFDIETTGFLRDKDRIIEIGFQDLRGGANSTFQTLVNPGPWCDVPNFEVHGITTSMVRRPDVPRMEDLIPVLLQYVRSRHKPEGYVLFVAHNARTFDVPFIMSEFDRCSVDIPSNWLFLDSLPLARELMKSQGLKLSSKMSSLCEYYDITLTGAHRAMVDVNALSLIFQRLTFDLKLSLGSLVLRSFLASEVNFRKKGTK
ncbi:exonuclease DPD1, chloroplastic/mitochondrial isoform X2 [Tripterygium wilfordii]|nr:exonuclease DPD1, chloroplastic/mitochondrial isoform X2 [Tripterygium wilfordii]